jgi:hypothetical protein
MSVSKEALACFLIAAGVWAIALFGIHWVH